MKVELVESQIFAVVIPAYRVEKEIEGVIRSIPSFVTHIIVVNDGSQDQTETIIQKMMSHDHRIHLISHLRNSGVGGAMISGIQKAIELNVDIIIKMDGDGQMDAEFLSTLITPLLEGRADYVKGNRFYDFVALRRMPLIRKFGNTILGFLSKAATGYWNVFDPTNGYIAMRSEKIKQLRFENIAKSYYFEISMLANLYLLNARVVDVPIPAIYKNETSNLRIERILFEFPPRLIKDLIKRIFLRYFLYDFSMVSVYFLTGIPMLLFGVIFGSIKWIDYAVQGVEAPTGTIVLPMMCVLLGIQFILSAIHIDIQSMPK